MVNSHQKTTEEFRVIGDYAIIMVLWDFMVASGSHIHLFKTTFPLASHSFHDKDIIKESDNFVSSFNCGAVMEGRSGNEGLSGNGGMEAVEPGLNMQLACTAFVPFFATHPQPLRLVVSC